MVRNLEHGLQEKAVAVDVLHFDPESFRPSLNELIPTPRWIAAPGRLPNLQYAFQKGQYTATNNAIDKFDPDVVHAIHVRNWSALVAANERGIPTVLSTHALELAERQLSQNAIANADIVHAVSHFTERLVRDTVNEDDLDTKVIPPSIDLPAFRAARDAICQLESGPVLTISRFVERKNIGTIVRAWKELGKEVKDGRELIIVGDGPKRKEIAQLAKEQQDIRMVGWVEESHKRRLLAKADLFALLPHQIGYDVEGFGIVYIEAQAAKTPILASKHGGVPEAVDDAGVLVQDESDPEEVAIEMERLLSDSSVRQDCLAHAEKRINQFDIPVITTSFLDLYDRLT